MAERKSKWLSGARINPEPIRAGMGAADLVDLDWEPYLQPTGRTSLPTSATP